MNIVSARAAAALAVDAVIHQQQSLADALPPLLEGTKARDRGLVQELSYGTLRYWGRYQAILNQLVQQPPKGKNRLVLPLLAVGLYQLLETRIPPHAALAETVNATRDLKLDSLRVMTNGVLRNFQRQQDKLLAQIEANAQAQYSHPQWLVKTLQRQFPEQWQQVLNANNQRPPMWLRVNEQKVSRDDYLQQLQAAEINASIDNDTSSAILLEQGTSVELLPGFFDGLVSVQDLAAQQAAHLLPLQANARVADVCAAPGGKTAHILERCPSAQVLALDVDEQRLSRVHENLDRLGLSAECQAADAIVFAEEYQGEAFDHVLLDAPCSGTGVIRRHPDIKWLRRDTDIRPLTHLQAKLLDAWWPLVKPGGHLLYATCSLLAAENRQQIEAFLARQQNARLLPIAQGSEFGDWIIAANPRNMDGFYYALLVKDL